METVTERLARLALSVSERRAVALEEAHTIGVSDEVFVELATSRSLSRKDTIRLPAHRFENLSRGRGWARKGKGPSAVWGEREEGGYRVGPGYWIVGGNDGFSRKGEDT